MSTFEKSYVSEPLAPYVFKETCLGISWDVIGVAILVIAVSALRLPVMSWAHEMNLDESQMLSQGMKFLIDPVPWRGVDGTSSGPLNSYFLSLFLMLGIKPGYVLLHTLADLLVCGQLSIVYLTLSRISSRTLAMWAMVPMLLGLGNSLDLNFLHFSSELLPGLLLAIAFHLFVGMVQAQSEANSTPKTVPLFLAGLAIGMSPWCKLQALPMAAVLGAAISAHVFFSHRARANAFSLLCKFWLAVSLPGVLILGATAEGGALKDFWNSYVLGNKAYAGPLLLGKLMFSMSWALLLPETKLLTGLLLLALLLRVVLGRKRESLEVRSEQNWILGTAACFFAAALFAVCRPGFPFAHYTIFLFPALTYLIVILFSDLTLPSQSMSKDWVRIALQVSAVCVTVLIASYIGNRIKIFREAIKPEPNASEKITAEVRNLQASHSIKSIAIWGWEPGVYVLTGIPPGTRDAIGHFVISLGATKPYFRQRFLGDLQKAKPDLFIDAVAKGAFLWTWTENDGYDSDPGLKAYIDEHYVLVSQLSLKAGAKPVRIFERR